MKELNIFVLLPEANPLHSFLHNADDFVEEEQLRIFLTEFMKSIEWVYREKNATAFYSFENIQRFLDNFDGFKDDYLFNPAAAIEDILADAYNWQDQQLQEHNSAYFVWHKQTAHFVVNHTFSEISERQKNSPQQVSLLFNFRAATLDSNQITILKEEIENKQLSIDSFSYVSNLNQLYEWLVQNREKRNFNINPKHGETGIAAHNKSRGNEVSLLMCNRHQAQVLLDKAIGDVRLTTELYNFDTLYQRFIVFRFENETPQNQYHGYHPNNQDEIPHDFKQLIKDIGQA